MRFRDYRDRETRSRWIEVQLSRHEELDEGLAAWLERTRDRSLLEVRRVRAGGPGVRGAAGAEPPALLYDVTGLVTLPELLRADAVSRQQYEAMLFSVADLASALESAPCSLAAADFRPQHVFALGDGALTWDGGSMALRRGDCVFVPAQGAPAALCGTLDVLACWPGCK